MSDSKIVPVNNMNMLTIFFDGACPLCRTEMKSLKQHDKQKKITLVDLHTLNFEQLYPHIDVTKAMKILHGTYQGQTLLGLQVTHRAWTLVGKGFWVAPLNWPIIKTLSHYVYLGVAKYRHPISNVISKLFNLNPNTCKTGVCFDKTSNTHHRRK